MAHLRRRCQQALRSSMFSSRFLDLLATKEMYFTSGTSGRSKGVLLSHKIVHAHALHCIAEHRFSSRDVPRSLQTAAPLLF